MPHAIAALGLTWFAAVATSCATSSLAGGLDSPVPAARLRAIEQARAGGDRSPATLRRLIEQLDSDDAAVRLVAITALEELTGETYGYRHDDPVAARRAAVARWLDHPGVAGPTATHGTALSGAADHG